MDNNPQELPAPAIPREGAPADRAQQLAVHQALYFALKLLDTPNSPLGADADEARRALRRAWVATHRGEWDAHYSVPREPKTERAMYREWKKQNADAIAVADFAPLQASEATQESWLQYLKENQK